MSFTQGVIFILTEKCNGRCVMCNYWRTEMPASLDADAIITFGETHICSSPGFVTLSGGEPLLYPELYRVASFFKSHGKTMVLSTNGISLHEHEDRVCELFDKVIVSLNGVDAPTQRKICGVDSFEAIVEATRSILCHGTGPRVVFKMTIQKQNYRQLCDFVELSLREGVSGIAVAVPDVYSDAFHRHAPTEREKSRVLLDRKQTKEFERIVEDLLEKYGEQLTNGFLVEGNLRRFVDYFKYYAGLKDSLPTRRCILPGNRLVVTPKGEIKFCFFHEPVGNIHSVSPVLLEEASREACLDRMDAATNPTCRMCYQFIDWSFI